MRDGDDVGLKTRHNSVLHVRKQELPFGNAQSKASKEQMRRSTTGQPISVILSMLAILGVGLVLDSKDNRTKRNRDWTSNALAQLDSQINEIERSRAYVRSERSRLLARNDLTDVQRRNAERNTSFMLHAALVSLNWCYNVDEALNHLRSQEIKPTTLILCQCDVSDIGLKHLYGQRQLSLLKIIGCPYVTNAGIDRLERRLKNCRVSVYR